MKTLRNPRTLAALTSHPFTREWLGEPYLASAVAARFDRDEELIRQGVDHRTLFLLLEGKVCISAVLPGGKRRILRTQQAPALLGEMELLELIPPPMTVRAMEPCTALLLPYASVRRGLMKDPVFLKKLAILMARKEQAGTRALFESFTYPLEHRLARFLLDMQEDGWFRVRKVEGADSLGVSYRHYSEVLGRFVREGLLRKEGFSYELTDPEALLKLCQKEP